MSPGPHASLRADVEEIVGRHQLVAGFGCLPFTPDRDYTRREPLGALYRTSDGPAARPARGKCHICGRPLDQAAPAVAPGDPDCIDCAGCNRAHPAVDAVIAEKLHRERQRQHLVNHNRQLTAGTPVPAILAEPGPEPAPAPRKARRPKEAASC